MRKYRTCAPWCNSARWERGKATVNSLHVRIFDPTRFREAFGHCICREILMIWRVAAFRYCMAHDVFISHSNQDSTVASAMCARLEQAGIRCWIAPRDVRPGKNSDREIIRGLNDARVVIVVLSANTNRSRKVIKEVERAFYKRIFIIPVRTEEVEPSEALECFLSSEQWLDEVILPLETQIDQLARTVKEYLLEQG